MICNTKVMVQVSIGIMEYRDVAYKCGETGPRGQLVLCSECELRLMKEYPQGWRNVPGDTCVHGTYVGDAYGPDYMCSQCENGE